MNEPEVIKVVLVGESGVGKTSIISKFTTNKFDKMCQPSLNSQYSSKILEFPEYHKSLKFDIWDTVGQEKYRSLAKIFYRDASVIILVYDITSETSFQAIKDFWYVESEKYANKKPLFVIVANKADLSKSERTNYFVGLKFAKEIKAIFTQTSASSNMGINDLFTNIGEKLLDPEYEINYDENIFENQIYNKKLKELNEIASIKSNNTNVTIKTNKNKKLIKLEVFGKEEGTEENAKKKCCH